MLIFSKRIARGNNSAADTAINRSRAITRSSQFADFIVQTSGYRRTAGLHADSIRQGFIVTPGGSFNERLNGEIANELARIHPGDDIN